MKDYFDFLARVLVLLSVLTIPAMAHPGSGIIVDHRGRVYFSEAGDIDAHLPGAIWQIDEQGKLTRFHVGGAHYLALDLKRGFAQTILDRWFGQRVTPWLQRVDTADAALIQADGQPIALSRDGSLYYAKRNVELIRLTWDGKLTAVAPTLDAGKRGGIKGLAFGSDDMLYVACPGTILKVAMTGTISTLIQSITVPDCDQEIPPNTPESQSAFLRGLAVAEDGTVYAAATGCRAVVKVTSSGQMSVVMRSDRPWSPTGVAVRGGAVYVLEYEHPHSAKREEWVPRVRKIGGDGKATTLATLPTAQGRPVSPQRRP